MYIHTHCTMSHQTYNVDNVSCFEYYEMGGFDSFNRFNIDEDYQECPESIYNSEYATLRNLSIYKSGGLSSVCHYIQCELPIIYYMRRLSDNSCALSTSVNNSILQQKTM